MNRCRPFLFCLCVVSFLPILTAKTLVQVSLKQGGSIQAYLKGYDANGAIRLISENDQDIYIKNGSWTNLRVIATPKEAKITNVFERNQLQMAKVENPKKPNKPEVKLIPQWRKDLDLKLGGRFNGRKGRSDSEDISFIADIDYKNKFGTHIEFELRADFRQRNRETTRRSYDFDIDYEKSYLTTPFGWYTNIDYETYDFQNLRNHELYELGLLFNFLRGKDIRNKSFSIRAGGLSKKVEYENTGTENDKGYSAGYRYYYNVRKKIKIESEAALEMFSNQTSLNRITSEHAVEFPLGFIDRMSLRIGVEYNYILNPEVGDKNADLRYFNNILWRF